MCHPQAITNSAKAGDVKHRIWQNIVDKAEPHDVKRRVGKVFLT
jgi:hypothetical protein